MAKFTTEENRELELKFTPSREVQARLRSRQDPNQIVEVLKGAFDLGDYRFDGEVCQHIVDTYYDSVDLAFYRSRATFRVRDRGTDTIEVTLKTSRTHSPGVFDRKEHTTQVSRAQLEQLRTEGFRSLLQPQVPDYAGFAVLPILTVTNDRRKFNVRRNDEHLELCLDTFRCDRPKKVSNRRSLFEIEIEAKNQAALDRLVRIRKSIGAIVPSLVAEDKSKYEQSVELLGLNRGPLLQKCLDLWHSPNFGTWAGVAVSTLGVILAVLIYWLQK